MTALYSDMFIFRLLPVRALSIKTGGRLGGPESAIRDSLCLNAQLLRIVAKGRSHDQQHTKAARLPLAECYINRRRQQKHKEEMWCDQEAESGSYSSGFKRKKRQLSNERVTADIVIQLLVENSGEWMMSLKENVSRLKRTWISHYCLQTDQSIFYISIHEWKGWFLSWDFIRIILVSLEALKRKAAASPGAWPMCSNNMRSKFGNACLSQLIWSISGCWANNKYQNISMQEEEAESPEASEMPPVTVFNGKRGCSRQPLPRAGARE